MSRFNRGAGQGSWVIRIARQSFLIFALLPAVAISVFAQATPPWSKGEGNPAADKGYEFQVPDIDNVADLHGNPEGAKLVLFIGGNQFFVLPELVSAFLKHHPDLQGRIFYETLPPGILLKQIQSHNTITLGNFTLTIQPDVYEADLTVVADMEKRNLVEKPATYATNVLSIMTSAANPKQIHSLRDLGRADVRLSMPNPQWEGIAKQIGDALRKAGGDPLFRSVYETKVQDGSSYLTQIHHRQTAMRIMKGESDAGVTWSSEVRFQEKIGNPISGIEIPVEQNFTAVYGAAVLRNAPHAEAARAWVSFLNSPEAQAVYKEYGFGTAKQ
jgi:ABC-type molybdate transport system substrate-binding protein